MPLRPHRRSYLSMTILASLTGVALLILLGVALSVPRWNLTHTAFPSWVVWLVVIPVTIGLALAAAFAAVVTVGGAVVLYRDAREDRGVPYFPVRPRERTAGPILSAIRRFVNVGAKLRAGELVEVRSLEEILATLDERGCLDGLPFMPEMIPFCGHRFPVQRRIEKVYEYAHGTGMRRMHSTVLLENLRCNGRSHGGCQAGCQFIWKEVWLKRPVVRNVPVAVVPRSIDLVAQTQTTVEGALRYVCQMTEIIRATTLLPRWDVLHYWRDVSRGNVRPGRFFIGIGVKMFNRMQWMFRRPIWPLIQLPDSDASPRANLGLQPGDLVRVKPKHAIEVTLNRNHRNRGLQFDRSMLAYSGGSYRVAARVERMVHEATGELLTFKTPSISLEGVYFHGEDRFVAANDYVFWREIWLERVPPEPADESEG